MTRSVSAVIVLFEGHKKFVSFDRMSMRMTPGKIYAGSAIIITAMTLWNRYSTQNLRTIVDDAKERQLKEAALIREASNNNI